MPEPSDQFPGTAAAPASLHTRVTDDENLRAALKRVADAGRELLSNCQAASVTLIERGRAVTASSTSDAALALDEAQYAVDDGPCLTAARTGQPVLLDDVRAHGEWQAFRDEAVALDLLSSMSIPFQLDGRTQGGLNVYGRPTHAFNEDDRRLAAGFAAQASIVVANAQAFWAAFDATQNLTIALERRAVIEQAKGVLMARQGLDDAQAFAELRRRSQEANRKLRDVAIEVVEAAQRDPRP